MKTIGVGSMVIIKDTGLVGYVAQRFYDQNVNEHYYRVVETAQYPWHASRNDCYIHESDLAPLPTAESEMNCENPENSEDYDILFAYITHLRTKNKV